MSDLQLKTIHFLCLLLDASLNISTSHFTSTPSAFQVILQLTHYTNYLLTYLLTRNLLCSTDTGYSRFVAHRPSLMKRLMIRDVVRRCSKAITSNSVYLFYTFTVLHSTNCLLFKHNRTLINGACFPVLLWFPLYQIAYRPTVYNTYACCKLLSRIFGPGRRVPKSHCSCCCSCCWNQFSKGPKIPQCFLDTQRSATKLCVRIRADIAHIYAASDFSHIF